MNSKYKAFHSRLASWYGNHGRHSLPWRTHHTPYTVYVSEIMLQQTQVKTVLERFFHPFMERFPTLSALAAASEEEVLKQWQGLGYYSRARNLHRAAQLATPALPDTLEGLLALPGIGQNTAHAILAFGFGKPYAVMEANLKRVLCRIFALESPTPRQLWDKAELLLNKQQPFDYNQAMMDVGAMVCTPKAPQCHACPAATLCAGKDNPTAYPAPKAAKTIPVRHRHIIMLRDKAGRIYCTPRATRFLGGLYGFVELEQTQHSYTHHGADYTLGKASLIGHVSHTYSHFRLEADVHLMNVPLLANEQGWYAPETLDALPMSKADEKALIVFRNAATNAAAASMPTARKRKSRA